VLEQPPLSIWNGHLEIMNLTVAFILFCMFQKAVPRPAKRKIAFASGETWQSSWRLSEPGAAHLEQPGSTSMTAEMHATVRGARECEYGFLGCRMSILRSARFGASIGRLSKASPAVVVPNVAIPEDIHQAEVAHL
jgi:hypothetical protein